METEYRHENNTPSNGVCAGPLAMACVPMQRWRQLFEPADGFERGTIFMELDKPFLGRAGCGA